MESPETVQFSCPSCQGLLTVPLPPQLLRGPCPFCGVGILFDPKTGLAGVDPVLVSPIPSPKPNPQASPPSGTEVSAEEPAPRSELPSQEPSQGEAPRQSVPPAQAQEVPQAVPPAGAIPPVGASKPLPSSSATANQPFPGQMGDQPSQASPQTPLPPTAEESRAGETPPVHLGRLLAFILLGLFFLLLAGAALFALVSSLKGSGQADSDEALEAPVEASAVESENSDSPEESTVDSVAESTAPVEVPTGDPTPDPDSLISALLSNADGQNLLPYVLRGGEIGPQVKAYYRENPPEGSRYQSTDFTKISLGEEDAVRGLSCYLLPGVDGDSPRAALFVRAGKDGNHRADWETFVQTRDQALEKFIENPQPGARGHFRVNMKRVHHLGARVPKAGNYVFVVVKSPTQASWDGATEFYVPMISSLGEAFLAKLGWGEGVAATAWFKWEDVDGTPQLAIDVLSCWEYLGVGNDIVEDISAGPCLAIPEA